jgi:4'-phosphopantetheinyl transferase
MIPLPLGEIHVWLTFTSDITNDRLYRAYRGLLTDEERHQESKFNFECDRKQYLITRALVRTVLSRYARVSPEDWLFAKNAYGRPRIENFGIDCSRLIFNISHTSGLIVLGVTTHGDLGLDTENVALGKNSLDVAHNLLAPEEARDLAALPLERQSDRLIEYWTLKESYIKARSMGLSVPLDKFSFRFSDQDSIKFTTHPELTDAATRWQFWQFRPAPNYLVAVCCERLYQQPSKLVVRTLIPMSIEQNLEVTFLRNSK